MNEIFKLSETDVKLIAEACFKLLQKEPKIKYALGREWLKQFPNKAGIYAIYDLDELVYIGETAKINKRMGDLRRTANHTFRKKLAKKKFPQAEIIKGKYKFKISIEEKLNKYCIENISISSLVLPFGRLEVETNLIEEYTKTKLNSPSKRSQ